MTNQDDTAIRQVFQRLIDAWNVGDANAYGAEFTDDADYVAFDGVNQKSRQGIIASHRPLFERFLKGSKLTGELVSIRLLAPDVAVAHAVGSILDRGRRTPKPERLSSQTMVLLKRDGLWQVTAFHNTRVRPIGRGFGGFVAWQLADLTWRLLGSRPDGAV
jgi:uncharacterized protein (TIGR02246 family)